MRRGLAVLAAGGLLAGGLLAGACSGGDDGDRAASSSTSTTVVYSGDPGSPFCSLLRELGVDDVLNKPSESSTQMEAAFTHLLDVLHRTAAAAPPELQEDTALLAAGIAALDDALRSVGYSYDALAESPNGPEVSAAVNDPAFKVAGDHISAYKAQVCKL
jgi:hypothetical protein